jgi:hypothetical protein
MGTDMGYAFYSSGDFSTDKGQCFYGYVFLLLRKIYPDMGTRLWHRHNSKSYRYGLTDMVTQIIIIRAHAYVSVKILFKGLQIWAQGLPYGNLNAISIIIP